MFHQYPSGSIGSNRVSTTITSTLSNKNRHIFRSSPFDNTTHILILLVVFVPVIFTIILCTIAYCIYRYNRKRSERVPTNSPIVPVDQSGAPISTIIYNTNHRPFLFEESPPSYDSIADTKKDLNHITSNDQIQLSILPHTTTTRSTNDQVSPPSYIHLNESNK
ncbi:hypothetical protein I4U23_002580 [Adineta vaga]|nr:hypothetical protein I4U23_002580 [Adineta vaga]